MENFRNVRLARGADLTKLAELFNAYRCFYGCNSDLPLAMQFLSERFHNNESVIYIAETDKNKVLGFAQLYPTFSSVSTKRAWILNDLYVREDYRRHGIARKLIGATLEHAQETGAAWVSLQTATDNNQAQALYKSMGFKKEKYFLGYSFEFS